jgi:hypothetical protein
VNSLLPLLRLSGTLVVSTLIAAPGHPTPLPLRAVVELEEEVYRYTPADNGAGPMWCGGSTCLVNRAAFFCGVSDIIEPNPEWRAFKKELTGRD